MFRKLISTAKSAAGGGGGGTAQWICCSGVCDQWGCVTNSHLKHSLIIRPGNDWRKMGLTPALPWLQLSIWLGLFSRENDCNSMRNVNRFNSQMNRLVNNRLLSILHSWSQDCIQFISALLTGDYKNRNVKLFYLFIGFVCLLDHAMCCCYLFNILFNWFQFNLWYLMPRLN